MPGPLSPRTHIWFWEFDNSAKRKPRDPNSWELPGFRKRNLAAPQGHGICSWPAFSIVFLPTFPMSQEWENFLHLLNHFCMYAPTAGSSIPHSWTPRLHLSSLSSALSQLGQHTCWCGQESASLSRLYSQNLSFHSTQEPKSIPIVTGRSPYLDLLDELPFKFWLHSASECRSTPHLTLGSQWGPSIRGEG